MINRAPRSAEFGTRGLHFDLKEVAELVLPVAAVGLGFVKDLEAEEVVFEVLGELFPNDPPSCETVTRDPRSIAKVLKTE